MKNKIQLVIPMAGTGSRFAEAGYPVTKPLLPIGKLKMYELVIANLFSSELQSINIVARSEFGLCTEIPNLEKTFKIEINLTEISYTTQGPAETVELVKNKLDPKSPLVIANSDQYVDFNVRRFYQSLLAKDVVGSILCMRDNDPKWSYVRVDKNNNFIEIKEKEVISNLATVGIYGFNQAQIFFDALAKMKQMELKVNGEFYVAPCYNLISADKGKVSLMDLGPVGDVVFGLGTPLDYENFLVSKTKERSLAAANHYYKK